MKKIFIGFLLIFLDFDLNLGNSKIGLIPDFIGYIVMINGLLEMEGESPLFIKVKSFATLMAVYTGILYFMDLVGISTASGSLSIILGITSTVISLYISWNIIMSVKDMEEKYNASLNGNSLKSTWTILAIFNILNFVFILIPALAILCIVVSFIVAICFLAAFNNSKNLYYELKNSIE